MCLNLSCLRYGCQWCTLAAAQQCPSPTILSAAFNFPEIFKCTFKIYGIWPQTNKYVTNTLPQCSPASVGLTQARPNKRRQTVWGEDLRLRDVLNAIQHTSSVAAKSKNFLTALQIAREQSENNECYKRKKAEASDHCKLPPYNGLVL